MRFIVVMLLMSDLFPTCVLVERSPLLVFHPCPLIVSSLLGKYFATALTVRLGHDAYCLFFIARIHDGLVGKPAHA